MRLAIIGVLLAVGACMDGGDGRSEQPDAMPRCAEIGCNGDLVCNRLGVCQCPQPDGDTEYCSR